MKTVYLCHKIEGDARENVKSVRTTIEALTAEGTTAIVPYLDRLETLEGSVSEGLARKMSPNESVFETGELTEVIVAGDQVTPRMYGEMKRCMQHGVTLRCYRQKEALAVERKKVAGWESGVETELTAEEEGDYRRYRSYCGAVEMFHIVQDMHTKGPFAPAAIERYVLGLIESRR